VYHSERVAFNTIVALLYTLLYTANCTVLEDRVPLTTEDCTTVPPPDTCVPHGSEG